MRTYNNYESSVLNSLDYDFASEIYTKSHPWYQLSILLKQELEDTYNNKIFNIKFEIKNGFYNLRIYGQSQRDLEVFCPDPFPNYSKDKKLLAIVDNCIQITQAETLVNLPLNANGVGLRNYKLVCQNKAISEAQFVLKKKLLKKHSYLCDVLIFDGIITLLLEDEDTIKTFLNNNDSDIIKNKCFKILKKYDKHQVISLDTLNIRIDDYTIYKRIGGQHYFNSDYYINAQRI